MRDLVDLCLAELCAHEPKRVYRRLTTWAESEQALRRELPPQTVHATLRGVQRACEHLVRNEVVLAEHALVLVLALY